VPDVPKPRADTILRMRLVKERVRLENLAQQQGYDSFEAMVRDLYEVQHISIEKLAAQFFTPVRKFRQRMLEMGIELRPRGGKNNQKMILTPATVQEVLRDGISAVAARLGVDTLTLSERMKELEGK
jgi:hypothetical protein